MKDKFKLFLTVKTREKIVYQGQVKAASSFNTIGPFDILPEHENFISLINKALIIHELSGKKTEIQFDTALLRVVEDNLEVYLGVRNLSQLQTQK